MAFFFRWFSMTLLSLSLALVTYFKIIKRETLRVSLTFLSQPKFLRGLSFRWGGATKVPAGSSSSMFVGTSPAFDLAMFTACVLRGRAPGGGAIQWNGKRKTDCECNIHVPAGEPPQSLVRFKTVEDPHNEWVVTAYPLNVQ